jgi:hypothetical protein
LKKATNNNHNDIVKLLLDAKADPSEGGTDIYNTPLLSGK